jgi:hypothetical protein
MITAFSGQQAIQKSQFRADSTYLLYVCHVAEHWHAHVLKGFLRTKKVLLQKGSWFLSIDKNNYISNKRATAQ